MKGDERSAMACKTTHGAMANVVILSHLRQQLDAVEEVEERGRGLVD